MIGSACRKGEGHGEEMVGVWKGVYDTIEDRRVMG